MAINVDNIKEKIHDICVSATWMSTRVVMKVLDFSKNKDL